MPVLSFFNIFATFLSFSLKTRKNKFVSSSLQIGKRERRESCSAPRRRGGRQGAPVSLRRREEPEPRLLPKDAVQLVLPGARRELCAPGAVSSGARVFLGRFAGF